MLREERGNALVFREGLARGHVESYFLKFNEPASGRAAWIKFTLLAPKGRPDQAVGETWAVFFDVKGAPRIVGMKETFPIRACELARGPLRLRFGENILSPRRTTGSLHNARGEAIAWDLSWTEGAEPLFPFPDALYRLRLPKSKLVTPYPDSRFTGWLTVGGERWEVIDLRGMQGHNWGEEHAHYYGWAQGTVFDGGESGYFEGFSGKVKIGPVVTPFFSMAFLKIDGHLYRFDRPRTWLSRNLALATNRWTFELPGDGHILRGEIHAPRERFAGLHYYDPTGRVSYCLNSKVSDARIELVDRATGRTERTLTSTAGFALEVLTKDPGHGVAMVA